jgi:hypothetical protein
MISNKQALVLLVFLTFSGMVTAQNNTNSPYTRYGYGQLSDYGSANSRGMGGIGYGLRDGYYINTSNPAAYTAVDSLTFIFDAGISLQNTNFSNGTLKQNAKNSSFDYVTMQFRVGRHAAMSIGLMPYSNIGYNMSTTQEDPDSPSNYSVSTYSGGGGLHQLYVGVGVRPLKDFSIGANIAYLWGNMNHDIYTTFPGNSASYSYAETTVSSIKSYKLDLGAQYTFRFDKKRAATLGVVVSPGHNLGNDSYVQRQLGDVADAPQDTIFKLGTPLSLGIGATYTYNNQLIVGADFTLQAWDKVNFMNDPNAFSRRTKLAVGAEYIPNPIGRSYFSFIRYRVGAYYSQPYYKVKDVRAAKEFGISAGVGLPLPRTRSQISISGQFVRTKGADSRFVDENTLRICIGVTFNEVWFRKWKVQ